MENTIQAVLDTLRKNGQTEFEDAGSLRDFASDNYGIELSQREAAVVLDSLTGWSA